MKRLIAALGTTLPLVILLVTLPCATVALAAGGGARGGPIVFGANEDQPKFVEDRGAATYDQMSAIGMTENVISLTWDPAAEDAFPNRDAITAAIEAAGVRGVRVVLALYPARARAVADGGTAGFVDFCGQAAEAFPGAAAFIVGNEPNQPRFWQPQFDAAGKQVSAAAFMTVLAGCYDRIHTAGKPVVGVGLSPRGNDDPYAANNVSTSPVRFIAALGAAYRRSGRTAPLMDAFSFHPYPNVNSDTPQTGYRWPNAGVPDFARIKQALWDAFDGTPQPDVERGLPLWIDEVGWQVDTDGNAAYTGAENVPTIDEATQASYHAQVLRVAACDADVAAAHLFHWVDERARDSGFQSGEFRVDGQVRPAYAELARTIADTQGGTRCPGTRVSWKHSTGLENAAVEFGSLAARAPEQRTFPLVASADESATAVYALVRLGGRTLGGADRAAIRDALGGETRISRSAAFAVVRSRKASLRAHMRAPLELVTGGLDRAYYRYAVLLGAELNPARTAFFVSPAFQAGSGALSRPGRLGVATAPAAHVLLESALLRGRISVPLGTKIDAWYEYGPLGATAKRTPVQRFMGGEPVPAVQIRDLAPRLRWSYRLVARLAGTQTEVEGDTRAFTVMKPASRTVPLVVLGEIDAQPGRMDVSAVVSCTGRAKIALRVRRLARRDAPGDPAFHTVDSAQRSCGPDGQDLFLRLGHRLPRGAYLGRVVAASRGRETLRELRFTLR
jgi:hypothetical protein